MKTNPSEKLLRAAAATPALADKLRSIGSDSVVFDHVTAAAQPFVCALVIRSVRRRFWVICENVRRQEELHNELVNYYPEALLFPEQEMSAVENAIPDPEIAAERLAVMERFSNTKSCTILITRASLEELVPAPERIRSLQLRITLSKKLDLTQLAGKLAAAGYERVPLVSERGQFTVRGGILDLFSWQQPAPVRIELFDDCVESIREFDLDQQISVRHLDVATVLLGEPEDEMIPLHKQIRPTDLVVFIETHATHHSDAAVEITAGGAENEEDYDGAFFDHGLGVFDAGDLILAEAVRDRLFRQLLDWQKEGWNLTLFCNNEGEAERFRDLLTDTKVDARNITFASGSISSGFLFPAAKLAVLSDSELFGRYRAPSARRLAERRAKIAAGRSQIDFSELNEGDYVVHLELGIGLFNGLKTLPGNNNGTGQEVLELEFANEAKLYVPVEHSYLVSRYVGLGKRNPALNTLGDNRWAKAKKSAEKAVFDFASGLLSLHATRETAEGHAFPHDGRWQKEFELAFLYKETPDQLSAIFDTKTDMESLRPMDRLICGDVGFGKTEVAVRAAFKSVMDGKQVAILTPTTVLAQQHYHHFRERMSDYPVKVEMLSRFRSPADQRKTLEEMRDGTVDIVVGTHRLISNDVIFKDLGLVVVDEEQRFGVMHKERLKTRFPLVDVLTLSATPIPRTLYLSMMGARDMSLIETPPANRLPVETIICAYDERIIRDAINRELARQGQVYFLHNRVHSIEHMRERVRLLCPDARVDIGHGQMHEDDLEQVMSRFVAGETDVLISTTIIESGLDIPNANTILIDRADRFGLADLYQLRGRVGRAQHKAYAYFLLPRDMMTAGPARKRINAIKQYSSLGAGFKIAMRDLEIRGAGNILGTAQSGHIINVGFDLYCQLLKQAVAVLKGEKVQRRAETVMSLDFVSTTEADAIANSNRAPVFLPTSWIAETSVRMQAYRQISGLTNLDELMLLEKHWKDRFGSPPPAAENLLIWTKIRLIASRKKIARVETRDGKLMLTRGGDYVLLEGKFPRLTALTPDLNLRLLLEFVRTF